MVNTSNINNKDVATVVNAKEEILSHLPDYAFQCCICGDIIGDPLYRDLSGRYPRCVCHSCQCDHYYGTIKPKQENGWSSSRQDMMMLLYSQGYKHEEVSKILAIGVRKLYNLRQLISKHMEYLPEFVTQRRARIKEKENRVRKKR